MGQTSPLRRAREGAGLTVTEAARRANVIRKTIYDIEGGRDVRLSTLKKFAQIYDVPVSSLVSEDDAAAV